MGYEELTSNREVSFGAEWATTSSEHEHPGAWWLSWFKWTSEVLEPPSMMPHPCRSSMGKEWEQRATDLDAPYYYPQRLPLPVSTKRTSFTSPHSHGPIPGLHPPNSHSKNLEQWALLMPCTVWTFWLSLKPNSFLLNIWVFFFHFNPCCHGCILVKISSQLLICCKPMAQW